MAGKTSKSQPLIHAFFVPNCSKVSPAARDMKKLDASGIANIGPGRTFQGSRCLGYAWLGIGEGWGGGGLDCGVVGWASSEMGLGWAGWAGVEWSGV